MPPRELPGFYFDPERNRYFPLSNRPPQTASHFVSLQPKSKAPEPDHPPQRRRRRVLWTCPRQTTSAGHALEASALLHSRLAATSRFSSESVRWPFSGGGQSVCVFQTTPTHQFLGDSRGWLYRRARAQQRDVDPGEDMDHWTEWTPELSLAVLSEISALCTTNTRCVAVCFGSTTKICVQDAEVPGRTQLLHLSAVRDVRAASLQGRALVLGAADNAVLLADLDASDNTALRMLPTRSDVFTVAQQETLIYAGTRAGSVLRFDTRLSAKGAAQVLFQSGPGNDNSLVDPVTQRTGRSSVVFVRPMRSQPQQVVIGYMDGRMGAYDLRFARPTAGPVVSYAGNPSSLSCNGRLGITLDPSERFLFAAGADHRLRAWALDSGAPVGPSAGPLPASSTSSSRSEHPNIPPRRNESGNRNPFAQPFATPFTALQVVDADDGPGQVLWAGGGSEVWHWRLRV
ncbi:hypothetical protein K438DRAFT_830212 [Mycena galopus ATCC 62051]|nr:hypothetical protein K438DRAFT_830212 [Mycena galopus ATCC 62051]